MSFYGIEMHGRLWWDLFCSEDCVEQVHPGERPEFFADSHLFLERSGTDLLRWQGLPVCFHCDQPLRLHGFCTIRRLITQGDRLPTPTGRSTDLEYYLTDGDSDDAEGPDRLENHTWYEIDLPIHYLGCRFTHNELSQHPLTADQLQKERDRETHLTIAMSKHGGWAGLLQASPVIATYQSVGQYDQPDFHFQLRLVDGWHRCKLAQRAGLYTVRAAVGVHPSITHP